MEPTDGSGSHPRVPTVGLAGGAVACVFFAVFVTWPQALVIPSQVATHIDPLFSTWRLAWFAHALREAPRHLLDGNIFYPATRTLTFSDATLLEGIVATPLLWIRVSPVTTYNVLLLGGMAASGFGMFLLARGVSGNALAALVAAAIFTMAPYRIEHFMHLELQWAMWVPLTFWAVHRTFERPSARSGSLIGLFLFLQFASCVYYGVFLALVMPAFVVLVGAAVPHRMRIALPALGVAVAVAGVLTAPYAWVYFKTAAMLGPRSPDELTAYSATALNYLAAPPQNWLWGWTAARFGRVELSLYPGVVAIALASAAFFYRPRRFALAYAAVATLAIDLSLGSNGWTFPWVMRAGISGLRAPARATIVALCPIALLACFGVTALQKYLTRRGLAGTALVPAIALVLVLADFANTGMFLMPADNPNAPVYSLLRTAGPGVVVELPVPLPEALPGRDPSYQYWSISHWHPLVNGYSGYYAPAYIETLELMRTFPDDRSIERLRTLGVRYLIVHRAYYDAQAGTDLLLKLGGRRELQSYGSYKDPVGVADVFLLK